MSQPILLRHLSPCTRRLILVILYLKVTRAVKEPRYGVREEKSTIITLEIEFLTWKFSAHKQTTPIGNSRIFSRKWWIHVACKKILSHNWIHYCARRRRRPQSHVRRHRRKTFLIISCRQWQRQRRPQERHRRLWLRRVVRE